MSRPNSLLFLTSKRQRGPSVPRKTRRLWLEPLESRRCLALDVPVFESLPGANHSIFLDFDGHVTTNTNWNSYFNQATINSPAYNTDGDAANFSAAELTDIERIWQRVSEDFLPFAVNVTTKDPGIEALRNMGGTDAQWGVRTVITKDNVGCGCGGVAYVGSFTWSSDTPVFVYNTGDKYVAEAASHEVGHSFGLSHDGNSTSSYYYGHGSGTTGWAPIMGVGYNKNVTQWDKGEYYGANNKQDDLAIITTNNGFGYRADDHGGTLSSASSLAGTGTSVHATGIIGRSTDVDLFSFTTGDGVVSLQVAPAGLGANLDVKADLLDSAGNLVATSNGAETLAASFNVTLAAGLYYVRVDGTGAGTPGFNPPTGYTDYGSLGRYTITGTVVAPTNDSLSIAATDANKAEGNDGTTAFTFTVNRAGEVSGTTSVNYSVSGTGSAPASGSDFDGGVFASGSLQFDPGVTSQTITVLVAGDTVEEAAETFQVTLSDASGATLIATATATGTIGNDDTPAPSPTISIAASNASKAEGTNATNPTSFLFTLTRSGDTSGSATVSYKVAGIGKWGAGAADFHGNVLPSGAVTFQPGESNMQLTILVNAETVAEKNEGFRVHLSNPKGATLQTNAADGSIINDDSQVRGKIKPPSIPLPVREPLPGAEHHDEDHAHEGHPGEGTVLSSHVGLNASGVGSFRQSGAATAAELRSMAVARSIGSRDRETLVMSSLDDENLLDLLAAASGRGRRGEQAKHAGKALARVDGVFASGAHDLRELD